MKTLKTTPGKTSTFTVARFATLALVTTLLTPAALLAGSINYGNFSGATVEYLDVTEDSNTGDALPLYGAPTVQGDSLDFNPIGFSATASGENGVDQTDGQLFFMVEAKIGSRIDGIVIEEAGDTGLTGIGTDATATQVRSDVFIDVLEIDRIPVTSPINLTASLIYSPSDGDYLLGTDGGGGPFFDTQWTGSTTVTFSPDVLGVTGRVTKINVTMDNQLSAISEAGTSATIAKKDTDTTGLTVEVFEIPEPATALLLLAGCVALTGARRSR